jgi:hypothetical protein
MIRIYINLVLSNPSSSFFVNVFSLVRDCSSYVSHDYSVRDRIREPLIVFVNGYSQFTPTVTSVGVKEDGAASAHLD